MADNISKITIPNGTSYDIKAMSIPMGTVDSGSTGTVITATVPGVTELKQGVLAYIRNGVVTSASGWTLNVNSLGAKPVYSSLSEASRTTTIFNINYAMLFIYNEDRVSGGCWDIFYGYDSNTNTIGYQLRTNSTSMPMKSITYRYRLLFTSADGQGLVPANNSTSTNATDSRTVCQDKIDPFGQIYYYGTTTSVAAGSRPSATYLWTQYVITLGYSFNRTGAALTLTSWDPVYVVCNPQSDGSAIIDSTTPYVQALPTTADGKIYIFLGTAVSATTVEMTVEHPVYEFKDGQLRLYTNAAAGTQVSVDPVVLSGDEIARVNGTSIYSYQYNSRATYQTPIGALTDGVPLLTDLNSADLYLEISDKIPNGGVRFYGQLTSFTKTLNGTASTFTFGSGDRFALPYSYMLDVDGDAAFVFEGTVPIVNSLSSISESIHLQLVVLGQYLLATAYFIPTAADINAKQDTLTFDTQPTSGSTNVVTSGGVYAMIGDVETLLASI